MVQPVQYQSLGLDEQQGSLAPAWPRAQLQMDSVELLTAASHGGLILHVSRNMQPAVHTCGLSAGC